MIFPFNGSIYEALLLLKVWILPVVTYQTKPKIYMLKIQCKLFFVNMLSQRIYSPNEEIKNEWSTTMNIESSILCLRDNVVMPTTSI